jgi:Protein of unknown function (DUF2867)
MTAITLVNVPAQSVIYSTLLNADFYDAYQTINPHPERHALEIWLGTLAKIPAWIDRAMLLRNFIVSKVGLRDSGKISNAGVSKAIADYRVGDRVGIFTITHISESELVMGDDDKHLAVQVSLCKIDLNQVVISTVVHIHNWMGHAYMFFVKPMHRIIAPAVLSKI